MKHLILSLLLTIITLPLSALAQDGRVEDVTLKIYKDLKNARYESVEQKFKSYMEDGIKTRHGTDLTLEIIDDLITKINTEQTYNEWKNIEYEWNKNNPDSFIQNFFAQRLKHAEAKFFTQKGQTEKLRQSQRRRYKGTMSNSYNRYLDLIQKFPTEWRTHAHLTKKFNTYKLTQAEVNEHFLATQSLKKGEVTSMEGYIAAMSPYALGRNNDIISNGISNILKKYPERNLSKPEYIDDATKQEIQDEIFELSINKILLNAQKYAKQPDKKSTAPILIPMAYDIIYDDINKHYADRPEKIKQHPLSYKHQAIWNKIEQNFAELTKRYPNSGKHLNEYLKMSLKRGDNNKTAQILNKIIHNDPNYNQAELSPIQCEYFSHRLKTKDTQDNTKKMYNACKKALRYDKKEIFFYRIGWAARQEGKYEESNTYLKKAVESSPKNATYLTDICWNYKDQKHYDKALDYCDRAIAVDRKFARAWLGRSHINYYGFNNITQSQKDAQVYKSLTEKK